MKFRQGFVSNSSTSSFVVAGVLLDAKTNSCMDVLKKIFPDTIPEGEDAQEDWMYAMGHSKETWVRTSNGDNSLPKGKTFAGVLFAQFSNYGDSNKQLCLLSDLETKVEAIRSKLELSKEEYPTVLISGTRAC